MLDPATLAGPAIRGRDLDTAQRLVHALEAVADLVDAAGDLASVRPDRLATLIGSLTEPLAAELEALSVRAEAPPPSVVVVDDAVAAAAVRRAFDPRG